MSKDIFMKRKTATKILSFAILSSFFLPLFEWHSLEMTGLNYILSSQIPSYKYFLLPAPFAALFLLFDNLSEHGFFTNTKKMKEIFFIRIPDVQECDATIA